MTWKPYAFAGNALDARWCHSATVHENRILIYGGRSDENYYNNYISINFEKELIELKPEEQVKEKHKRNQDEQNRSREYIGNLQNQIIGLQSIVQSMGGQFIDQRKTLSETRAALLAIKQENDRIKRTIAELQALKEKSSN